MMDRYKTMHSLVTLNNFKLLACIAVFLATFNCNTPNSFTSKCINLIFLIKIINFSFLN